MSGIKSLCTWWGCWSKHNQLYVGVELTINSISQHYSPRGFDPGRGAEKSAPRLFYATRQNIRLYWWVQSLLSRREGNAYKWIDLKALVCHLLGSQNDVKSIKYFTALVSGRLDPHQPIWQKTYIRALKAHIPEFSVYYGHFLSHEVDAPIAASNPLRFARIIKTEEKGSDVNLDALVKSRKMALFENLYLIITVCYKASFGKFWLFTGSSTLTLS